jgi:flagellar basal body-associated protein FliL
VEENMAEEEIAEVEADSGEKKSSSSLVVIIIVAVVSIAIGFMGSKFLGGSKTEENTQTQQVEKKAEENQTKETDKKVENDTTAAQESDGNGEKKVNEAAESENTADQPGILIMDPFTVNLNDPFGRRYAQINLKLKVKNKGMTTKITGNELMMSEIRDEIFMVISSKSYNELKNTSGKITLKEEIRMRVNEIIKTQYDAEPILKIFFEKFLIQ